MRERATHLDGRLIFSSELGAGAKVELLVPGRKVYAKTEGALKTRWFGWRPRADRGI